MADPTKTFTQDWAANTVTGRVADTLTGGAISRAADKTAKAQRPTREYKRDKETGQFSSDEGVGLADIHKLYGKKGKP